MHIWDFLGLQPSHVVELASLKKRQIVSAPGVYVLLGPEGTPYRYPRGASPVFYIGESSTLADRIDRHRLRTSTVQRGKASGIEWPRYEYAAAHGCLVAAFPSLATTSKECRFIQDEVIALFAKFYGAPPIADASANRGRVLRRNPPLPPQGLTCRPWVLAPDA